MGAGIILAVILIFTAIFYTGIFKAGDPYREFKFTPGFMVIPIYMFILFFLFFYFFAEPLVRFGYDVSGKQSSFELLIPQQSWKKITAKLIVGIAGIIAVIIFDILAVFAISLILSGGSIVPFLAESLQKLPHFIFGDLITSILFVLFGFLSFYTLIFFCLSVSRSLSNKNKLSVLIGILTFIAYWIVTGILRGLILYIPSPVIRGFGSNSYLSAILLDIAIFAATFWGTSFLMEKKIES